jgi:hypothetical protein
MKHFAYFRKKFFSCRTACFQASLPVSLLPMAARCKREANYSKACASLQAFFCSLPSPASFQAALCADCRTGMALICLLS